MAQCSNLLQNQALVHQLKSTPFDLYMCDVIDLCASIVKRMLDLPTVAYSSHGGTPDNTFFPDIMSITPSIVAPVSDDLDFSGRLVNCLGHLFTQFASIPLMDMEMKKFADDRGLPLNVSMSNTFVDSLVLLGNDFVMEHPRPYMPNIVLVGGWFVDPPKPLTDDLRTFMDQSGDQGVVYVSFGTLIEATDKGKIFLNIFKKFPSYRFIWKYKGPPIDVSSNVFLTEWVPQNDLLAHEKLRLFITHCGCHSSYEAIYHGVPVVAIPLLVDQPSNAHRLTHRLQMGVLVDYQTMTEPILVDAINEVLSNNTYKANAMRARSLRQDQQTTPLNRVKFYIDYVIRHKGIGLLASKPLSKLSLMQLNSVDVVSVIMLIIIVMSISVFTLFKCFVRLISKICRNSKREKLKIK